MIRESFHAKPQIVYHGTSSALARSILKHGMQAVPKLRTWEVDPDTSVHTQSRQSLPGSYWTSNLMTAMSSVMKANQQHGSEQDWRKTPGLIVIAEIITQSAVADEDDLSGSLKMAWARMNSDVFGVIPEAVSQALWMYYENPRAHPGKREQMLNRFMSSLHAELQTSPQHPIPAALLERAFVAEMRRLWSYSARSMMDPTRGIDPMVLPPAPSVPEAEAEMLAVKAEMSRYYRKSTKRTPDMFRHTLRMDRDVGFSGPSKIIAMVQYDILNKANEPMTLIYGKSVPLDFIAQYRDRCGKFPGLNRADGALMIKADEKRSLDEAMTIGTLPSKGWFHVRARDYIPIQHLHYVDLIERPEAYGIENNPVLVKIRREKPTAMGMPDYVYNPDTWTELRNMMFDLGWVRVNGMNHGDIVIDANDMPSIAHTVLFLMDHGAMVDGVTYDVRYPNSSGITNGYIDERRLRVFLRNRGQERRSPVMPSPAGAAVGEPHTS